LFAERFYREGVLPVGLGVLSRVGSTDVVSAPLFERSTSRHRSWKTRPMVSIGKSAGYFEVAAPPSRATTASQ
jgi:hypothetical protein